MNIKKVQKILRALPGTEIGKKLALQDKISRADAAAVFVHELEVDRLFEKCGIVPKDIHNNYHLMFRTMC